MHTPVITDDLDSLLDEVLDDDEVHVPPAAASPIARSPVRAVEAATTPVLPRAIASRAAGVLTLVPASPLATALATEAFPWDAVGAIRKSMTGTTDKELVARLKVLSCKGSSSGALCPYDLVRDEICALNVELSTRKRCPPRFRFSRRPPPMQAGKWPTWGHVLVTDRVIFDLDWIWQCGRRSPVGGRDEFANLFAPEQLDRDLAFAFAAINVKLLQKLNWIGLEEDDELALELDTIQSTAMQARWATIMRGVISKGGGVTQIGHLQIAGRLHTDANGDPELMERADRWAMIWACDRLAGGKRALAIRLFQKADCSNTPMDPSNFTRTLAKIKKLCVTPKSLSVSLPGHPQ